jgi:hypothetical protein
MKLNQKIQCADGFTMSVQAHEGAYSTPRINDATNYTAVEVGFPNMVEELLLSYAEEPDIPRDTVYPYVPAQVIVNVIVKHRGIISGELPAGIPYLTHKDTTS